MHQAKRRDEFADRLIGCGGSAARALLPAPAAAPIVPAVSVPAVQREHDVRDCERHRLLCDASGEAMIVCRQESIIDANEAAARLFGIAPNALIGSALSSCLTLYRSGLPGYSSLAMARRADGSGLLVALLADREIAYADGERAELLAFRDLTELGPGDERLRQTLAEQQAILDGLQVGGGYFVDRRVVWVNRRWEAMFQRSMEEVHRLGTPSTSARTRNGSPSGSAPTRRWRGERT
jgi:PAS domain-containing protein